MANRGTRERRRSATSAPEARRRRPSNHHAGSHGRTATGDDCSEASRHAQTREGQADREPPTARTRRSQRGHHEAEGAEPSRLRQEQQRWQQQRAKSKAQAAAEARPRPTARRGTAARPARSSSDRPFRRASGSPLPRSRERRTARERPISFPGMRRLAAIAVALSAVLVIAPTAAPRRRRRSSRRVTLEAAVVRAMNRVRVSGRAAPAEDLAQPARGRARPFASDARARVLQPRVGGRHGVQRAHPQALPEQGVENVVGRRSAPREPGQRRGSHMRSSTPGSTHPPIGRSSSRRPGETPESERSTRPPRRRHSEEPRRSSSPPTSDCATDGSIS